MPKKKSEFEVLNSKKIIKVSSERKSLSGTKSSFFNLLSKALKVEPFDKKKKS